MVSVPHPGIRSATLQSLDDELTGTLDRQQPHPKFCYLHLHLRQSNIPGGERFVLRLQKGASCRKNLPVQTSEVSESATRAAHDVVEDTALKSAARVSSIGLV